jgi:hypothetical protein
MILALRQHRFVAAAAIVLAALSCPSTSVQAAEPSPSPHEAAILDRIFANWKARHDRVHTLHFTWDNRVTCKQGTQDFSSTQRPRTLLEKDRVFEQSGVQLWIDRDARTCFVRTASYKLPLRSEIDRERVVSQEVVVGNMTSLYTSGAQWQDGMSPPRAVPRYGLYFRTPSVSYPIDGLSVLLLAFRPQNPLVGCRRDSFSVVHEDVVINGMHCTELHRSVKRQEVGGGGWVVPREESLWVSPARDDAVVQWRSEIPKSKAWLGKINYKKDKTYGWVPLEWSSGYEGSEFNEYTVTGYTINQKIEPAVFSQDFLAGTPVMDEMKGNSAKNTRYYVIQDNGSKREISAQEFTRLAAF